MDILMSLFIGSSIISVIIIMTPCVMSWYRDKKEKRLLSQIDNLVRENLSLKESGVLNTTREDNFSARERFKGNSIQIRRLLDQKFLVRMH